MVLSRAPSSAASARRPPARAAGLVLALLLPFAAPATAQQPTAGEVSLPLDRYLDLVARAEREPVVEPAVAAVTRQTIRLSIDDDAVRATTEVEILVRGTKLEPVPISAPGTIERVAVEPADGGSVGWSPSAETDPGAQGARPAGLPQPVFLARRPGEHRIELASRLAPPTARGSTRVEIPATGTPLSVAEITLPSALAWSAPGAIVVADTESDATRLLVLALPAEHAVVFSARRAGAGEDDETRASTVTATRLDVGALGWLRTDVVLYEITRGTLPTLSLVAPASLDIERAVTSSGAALVLDEGEEGAGRRLRIEPEQPLEGAAFARLEQRTVPVEDEGFSIPLDPVRPGTAPRARYLLLATSVAADLAPEPASAWQRVDPADLPVTLRAALPATTPVSVWRRTGESAASGDPGAVVVSRVPLAERLPTVVRARRSTTLLTPEGTVVQREILELDSRAGSLELVLPADAVVWTARVGGVLVRPVVEGSSVRVPLSGGEDETCTVELLSVAAGAVPPGRTELGFALAEIAAPVLVHEWRLLLPADARYRFTAGELLPVTTVEATRPVGIDAAGTGSAAVTGTVRDESGHPLPGVLVTLTLGTTRRVVITDAHGRYAFTGLEPGRGTVEARLEGFQPGFVALRLRRDGGARADLSLSLGVSEAITVTSEAPLVDAFEVADEVGKIREEREAGAYQDALADLRQGTVGGVRPLEVEIPERGKLLLLSGALPPQQVSVTLEARRRR